ESMCLQLMSDLRQMRRTIGFAAGIHDFLRARVTLGRAEEEIKKRLHQRAERFLEVARTQIYNQLANPYLRLLKFAGCEYADLCNHVREHGLERTLERLAREGVYLTADEYKGKRDVVRAGESFRIVSRNFAEKDGARGLAMQSSGTRNVPARNMMTLDRIT